MSIEKSVWTGFYRFLNFRVKTLKTNVFICVYLVNYLPYMLLPYIRPSTFYWKPWCYKESRQNISVRFSFFCSAMRGLYRSWKTWKVMEFFNSFSRPGKSWNLSMHGSWKMTKNDFSENSKAKNTLNEWSFSHYFENSFSILGHGKHQNSHGILLHQKSTNPD